jgi:diguanylate cyclase (GGDEF)-like protein/PAS domain S-box-containing protein
MARDGSLADNMALPVTYPLCVQTLEHGVHVIGHDLAYRYPDQPWGTAHDGESYVGIRLDDRDGTVLGVLGAVVREPITEDEDTVALLRVFADRAAVELARVRREPHLLRAAAVLDHTSEGIAMAREDGRIMEANPALADLTGISAEALEQSSLFDLISEPAPSRIHDAVTSDGSWRGEVTATSRDRGPFSAWLTLTRFAVEEAGSAQARIVALLSDISGVRQSQAELEHLAHHDSLTGLPNRALFHDRVDQAIQSADRRGQRLALLFMDLDGFKDINDSLGHSEGDQLLTEVAQRLTGAMRASDTLARIGGDEFMVLLNGLADAETAGTASARLLDVFRDGFDVAGHDVFMTASAGISVYPRDGGSVETLIQSADAAMYDAKAAGKNTFRFFMPALAQNAFERVALVSAIRTALDNDEFYLCFQSQIALDDRRITGCEALLRWQRPSGETVMPGEFIPLAERSGLIKAIGQWVLESACRQGMAWLDEALEFGRIAVNVAATQISQSGFAEEVLNILDRTGLPAERLSIEITESLFLEPHAAVERTLSVLRDAGVEIAIDDFGKGYSSLAYLKRLPIDTVKLDKSFTSDIPHDGDSISITQAIVGLASNLGLSVVAEGIENDEQQLFLETLRCGRGQGFHYSRPVPAPEFTQVLRDIAARNRPETMILDPDQAPLH